MLVDDHTDTGKLFQAVGPALSNTKVSACFGNDQITVCSRTKDIRWQMKQNST